MRFMIIVKSCAQFESELQPNLDPAMMAAMGAYNAELARAGVLLDANGLRPSRDGWRIHYSDQGRQVVDGPFAQTQELVAGYTLIQVRSPEEAMEWSRRFPNPVREGAEAIIEVRPLYEPSDFQT